jgi:RNase H-like domain found in reverse transcriptase
MTLCVPAQDDQLTIKVNASGIATGSVLMKVTERTLDELSKMSDEKIFGATNTKICAVTSKILTVTENSYSTIEQELLLIGRAVKQFAPLLPLSLNHFGSLLTTRIYSSFPNSW